MTANPETPTDAAPVHDPSARSGVDRWAPGLAAFRAYRREWLRDDVVAGVSVAAVALPVAIAYAQIAGFPPQYGIYAAIFPPLAYAVFGTSRHVVINPDSATCAIIASTLAPLAAAGSDAYLDASIALAGLVGVLAVVGGLLRLGVVANFLARPILTGYMNGVAASILVGQLGPFLGLQVRTSGFFRQVFELGGRLLDAHAPTLAVGVSLFLLLRVLKRVAPSLPGPLFAAVAGAAAVVTLGLDTSGVTLVGAIPSGFSPPRWPHVPPDQFPQLLAGACSIVLVSYCSMMPAVRGYATRYGYPVDANKEFIALGAANIVSGLGQGFVVSGADSRTAVASAAGGKTQLTGIVAGLAMAAVLLFLTGPLALLPRAALAAIVISAVLGMFDARAVRHYFRVAPVEGWVSVLTTAGVVVLGLLPGILIALGFAFLRLLMLASYPHTAVLGVVDTAGGRHVATGPETARVPGLVMFRFDGALLFFNADWFKAQVLEAVAAEYTPAEWVLIDAESMPLVDFTGAETIRELHAELSQRGIVLAIARAGELFRQSLTRKGLVDVIGPARVFPSMRAGIEAFERRPRP